MLQLKKTSTLFSITLKRGKTIITKNYILFCLSLALSAWDVQFILFDRFISDKGRLKTKINSLISMLSKTRYFSTTVMRCCVNSHGTKSHSFRLSTYWSDNVLFTWNNFTARVSALTFLVLHPNPLAVQVNASIVLKGLRRGRNIFNALTRRLALLPPCKQAK